MQRSTYACRSFVLGAFTMASTGCQLFCHDKYRPPHITARPASVNNQCMPAGIPFYLPKPLLVVSKNFYHIEDPKVGLTGTAPIPSGFDQQAEYADVALNGNFTRSGKSDMNSSGAGGAAAKAENDGGGDGEQTASLAHSPTLHSNSIPSAPEKDAIPSDGLGPHTFFTYEIVFVPDLTEKYVLEVNGGPGEIRAAMNLVNGWQFTGLGPYYMKDSSTAQNTMARGVAINLGLGGAADVVNSVANLKSLAGSGKSVDPSAIAAMAEALEEAKKVTVFDIDALKDKWVQQTVVAEDGSVTTKWVPPTLERYAEIYVYEAVNEGGQMLWKPVANHCFDRQYLGVMKDARLQGGATTVGLTREKAKATAPDPAASGGSPSTPRSATLIIPQEEIPLSEEPSQPSSAPVTPDNADISPLSIMAHQALMNSAMEQAGFEAAPPVDGGAMAMAEGGSEFQLDLPRYKARGASVAAEAEKPLQLVDATAGTQVLQDALSPACEPCKKTWHDRLFPWKNAQHRNCEVNGVVSQ